MQRIISLILLSIISYSAQAEVPPSTKVYFIDECSGQQTFVTTPAGVSLKIELNHLFPYTNTEILAEYVPAGLSEDLSKKYLIALNSIYTSDAQGTLILKLPLPKNKLLNAIEAQIPGYNIWNVNLTWHQTNSKNETISSSNYSSLLRLQEMVPFYKVVSASKCYWETKPTINSEYYLNEDQPFMAIRRQITLSDPFGGENGITLGNSPMYAGNLMNVPMSHSSTLPAFGWFFKSWSKEKSLEESVEVSRAWSIPKNTGGFFFNRYSFKRVLAERYEWSANTQNGCGSFQKTASGDLDIGNNIDEFYSIPTYLSGSPEAALSFLEKLRPTLDTCKTGVQVSANKSDYLVSSDEGKLMFFYKDQGENK